MKTLFASLFLLSQFHSMAQFANQNTLVNSFQLNLREKPSSTSKIKKVLNWGDRVKVIDIITFFKTSKTPQKYFDIQFAWCKVVLLDTNESGYVNGKYLYQQEGFFTNKLYLHPTIPQGNWYGIKRNNNIYSIQQISPTFKFNSDFKDYNLGGNKYDYHLFTERKIKEKTIELIEAGIQLHPLNNLEFEIGGEKIKFECKGEIGIDENKNSYLQLSNINFSISEKQRNRIIVIDITGFFEEHEINKLYLNVVGDFDSNSMPEFVIRTDGNVYSKYFYFSVNEKYEIILESILYSYATC